MDHETEINGHYGRDDLGPRVLDALRDSGLDIENLRVRDLAAIDQFHIGGLRATMELAHAAGIDERRHVLDVGCGIGGPARTLASEFGCQVTGIDLTQSFVDVATSLSAGTECSAQVRFRQGNALDLPFASGVFDLVWMQHVSMNIADKRQLFVEARRVLKGDGRLAILEVVAGKGDSDALGYPVPWATNPATSFLSNEASLRRSLESAGFAVDVWQDVTVDAIEWFNQLRKPETVTRPLSLEVLMGPEFRTMADNVRRGLRDQSLAVCRGVCGTQS